MKQNNDIQTLLEYAGKLEWQPIESAPRDNAWMLITRADKQFSGIKIVLYCDETDKGYGINYLDEELNLIEETPTHWMPLPDGNAGAVIRELVEALGNLLQLNENYAYFGGEVYQDKVDKTWQDAQQALAKAAALVGGKDE